MCRCSPLALLAKAARRAAANAHTWDRLPPEGNPELRLWFARDVGGNARAEDVVLVSGGQAALAATFRTLVPFGGPILVESPTYFGALSVARSLGLRPVPVPLDAQGIRADLLEAAFASTGARALYLQPAFSNPSGGTLYEQRRKDVLQLAERAGAFVIEDDYARDLAFGSAPPAPLFRQGADRVVYIRSLTKSTAPGPARRRYRRQRSSAWASALAARDGGFLRLRAAAGHGARAGQRRGLGGVTSRGCGKLYASAGTEPCAPSPVSYQDLL